MNRGTLVVAIALLTLSGTEAADNKPPKIIHDLRIEGRAVEGVIQVNDYSGVTPGELKAGSLGVVAPLDDKPNPEWLDRWLNSRKPAQQASLAVYSEGFGLISFCVFTNVRFTGLGLNRGNETAKTENGRRFAVPANSGEIKLAYSGGWCPGRDKAGPAARAGK
jgi:hypothetical protein